MNRTLVILILSLALTQGCAKRQPSGNQPSSDGGGDHKDSGGVVPDFGGGRMDASGGCVDNNQCNKSDYCHIDQGCKVTGAKMGRCEPRPQGCNLLYAPVCGCDGKTHGNACGAAVAGVNVASQGPCTNTASCTDLANAYVIAVAQARDCTLGDGPKGPQCTKKVQDRLACGCPTFTNPWNNKPLAQMAILEQAWKANKCDITHGGACPPVPCRNPKGASCSGTAPGAVKGLCQDSY